MDDNAQKELLKAREKGFQYLFKGKTYQELRSLQIQSIDWLEKKLKEINSNFTNIRTPIPELGRMYLFCYKAKWANILPFWDRHPLVYVLKLNRGEGSGLEGINYHYLGLEQRIRLLNIIVNGADLTKEERDRRVIMTYQKLKHSAEMWVKFSYKRYLYSHLQTKFIMVPITNWKEILYLPLSRFEKATEAEVNSIATGRKWR